jgi:hypothetical protein
VAHFACFYSNHKKIKLFNSIGEFINTPLGDGGMKIFLIGFMGSGKTHWGRLLSDKLKLPFFDLDEQIIFAEKKSINDIFAGIFSDEREGIVACHHGKL